MYENATQCLYSVYSGQQILLYENATLLANIVVSLSRVCHNSCESNFVKAFKAKIVIIKQKLWEENIYVRVNWKKTRLFKEKFAYGKAD